MEYTQQEQSVSQSDSQPSDSEQQQQPNSQDNNQPSKEDDKKEEETKKKIGDMGGLAAIFFLFWVLLGIIAFIKSIICLTSPSTILQKILGLLLAIVVGPFYFLYFYVDPTYCKSRSGGRKRSRNNRKK